MTEEILYDFVKNHINILPDENHIEKYMKEKRLSLSIKKPLILFVFYFWEGRRNHKIREDFVYHYNKFGTDIVKAFGKKYANA